MQTKRLAVKPGDTVIAYVDDYTSCVGVVVSICDGFDPLLRTLILGWFTDSGWPPNKDVFGNQKMHPFLSYENLEEQAVLSYDFEREIQWCRDRDTAWWKSINPPCYPNLVAALFSPKQFAALQHLATARHFLAGGTMENYNGIGLYNSEEDCLRIWATLYCHFPNQVALPPKEMNAKNTNIWHLISVENGEPSVTFETR